MVILAASLEKKSEHPLAEAIIEKSKQMNEKILDIQDFVYTSGRGIKGKIDNKEYFGGNLLFINENNINIDEDLLNNGKDLSKQGKTVIYFADKDNVIGIIAVADTVKNTSFDAIKELKNRNIQVVMLTGDNKGVANTIAKNLNIDKVISEVMPVDKEKEVEKLQNEGKKVAFVGDGINDSPALVKADVGLAIGSGTDVAIESADIILMKDNLLDVVSAIDLSKAVIRNIKMNLFWAFFYNIIGIPIAAGVFYLSLGLKLSPMIGALAMSLSSVCVVTNALRLNNLKLNFKKEERKKMENVKIINIEGMQCNHCKMTVEKALNSIEGVTKVEVNLENKNAIIESEKEIDNNEIIKLIEEAGFEVKDIAKK